MTDQRFFTNHGPFTLGELSAISGTSLAKAEDASIIIRDVAPLNQAKEGHISFLSNKKYSADFKSSMASACVIDPAHKDAAPNGMALLLSTNPYAAFARISSYFYPIPTSFAPFIAPTAIVHETVTVGKNCHIDEYAVIREGVTLGDNVKVGSHTVIDKNVVIGNDCTLKSNITLSHTIIGNHVLIHPGVCIGQDGFGFAFDKGVHLKVPQLGRVLIGNHVEIGANSCIDRGAGPDTIIGDGCKIDNLVQIGHNVVLGKGCIIVAQVGIAGSSRLDDFVVVGGQAGIAGHLHIGSAVQIAAQSGIAQNVEPKAIVGGSPAMPIRDWHRLTITLKNLIKKKDNQ